MFVIEIVFFLGRMRKKGGGVEKNRPLAIEKPVELGVKKEID